MGMASSFNIEKPCPQFLLGFILVTIYVPGIVGASIPTGWSFLIALIPLLLFREIRITQAHILGSLFLLYCALSLVWTPNFNLGFSYLIKIIILGCVFCLGSSLTNIKWIIVGMSVGLIPSGILAILQYFRYSFVYTMSDYAGLFVNPNIFCETSAALLVASIVFRLWWCIPFTLPAFVFVHSRGALLGLAAGVFCILYKYNRTAFYITGIIAITCAILYYIDRFVASSIFERFDLWLDTIEGFKLFGNGIGSYEILYPYYATHIDTSIARPKFAHNDFLHIAFETGIGSILLVMFVINILKVRRDETIIFMVIGLMAMFFYTINVPSTGFLWVLLAGFVSRDLPSIWISGNDSRSYIFKGVAGKPI